MQKIDFSKYENLIVVKWISNFIGSKLFPIVLAAVILLCYYLGWDIVMIWFVAICSVGILLTCRDATPAFAIFLFINIIISLKNSPSVLGNESDYFMRPEIYGQVIAAISLCVIGLVARLTYNIYTKTFKPSPMFFGICALCAAFLLNGVLFEGYEPLDTVFGLFLTAMYILIFILISSNITPTKGTFEKIAFYCCVLFVVLAIELIVAYTTYDDLFVNGFVDRVKLFFGWGMYNTIGMLFCVCIPAWFYLAITQKYGWIYTVLGILNITITFFTFSRQSMLGAAVIGLVCVIWLLICRKGRDRLINIVILVTAMVCVGIVILAKWDKLAVYIQSIIDNLNDGGNRIELWKRAIEDFLKAPVFGVGFYYLKDLDVGFVGLDIIPKMYHNTILQILGACGIVGLAAYLLHRVQTVISLLKNINLERLYVAFTGGALLFVSLFDNHMFYLFPTLLYVGLVGLLKASENKKFKCQEKRNGK